MFSHAAKTTPTLIFSFSSATARSVPITLAAPHISRLHLVHRGTGLDREFRAESDVITHLPTNATGAPSPNPCTSARSAGAAVQNHFATDKNETIFGASSCLVSRTSMSSFHLVAILRASSARKLGDAGCWVAGYRVA